MAINIYYYAERLEAGTSQLKDTGASKEVLALSSHLKDLSKEVADLKDTISKISFSKGTGSGPKVDGYDLIVKLGERVAGVEKTIVKLSELAIASSPSTREIVVKQVDIGKKIVSTAAAPPQRIPSHEKYATSSEVASAVQAGRQRIVLPQKIDLDTTDYNRRSNQILNKEDVRLKQLGDSLYALQKTMQEGVEKSIKASGGGAQILGVGRAGPQFDLAKGKREWELQIVNMEKLRKSVSTAAGLIDKLPGSLTKTQVQATKQTGSANELRDLYKQLYTSYKVEQVSSGKAVAEIDRWISKLNSYEGTNDTVAKALKEFQAKTRTSVEGIASKEEIKKIYTEVVLPNKALDKFKADFVQSVTIPVIRRSSQGSFEISAKSESVKTASYFADLATGLEKLLREVKSQGGPTSEFAERIGTVSLRPEEKRAGQTTAAYRDVIDEVNALAGDLIQEIKTVRTKPGLALLKTGYTRAIQQRTAEKTGGMGSIVSLESRSLAELQKTAQAAGVSFYDVAKALNSISFSNFYDELNKTYSNVDKGLSAILGNVKDLDKADRAFRNIAAAKNTLLGFMSQVPAGQSKRSAYNQELVSARARGLIDKEGRPKDLSPDEQKQFIIDVNLISREIDNLNKVAGDFGESVRLTSSSISDTASSAVRKLRDENRYSITLGRENIREQSPFNLYNSLARQVSQGFNAYSGVGFTTPTVVSQEEASRIQAGKYGVTEQGAPAGYGHLPLVQYLNTAGTFEDQILIDAGSGIANAFVKIVKPALYPATDVERSIKGIEPGIKNISEAAKKYPKLLESQIGTSDFTKAVEGMTKRIQDVMGVETIYEGRADIAVLEKDIATVVKETSGKTVEAQVARISEVFLNYFGRKFATRAGTKGVSYTTTEIDENAKILRDILSSGTDVKLTEGRGSLGYVTKIKDAGQLASEIIEETYSDAASKYLSEQLKASGNKFIIDMFTDAGKGLVTEEEASKNRTLQKQAFKVLKGVSSGPEGITNLINLYEETFEGTGRSIQESIPIDARISSRGVAKRGLMTEAMTAMVHQLAGVGLTDITTLKDDPKNVFAAASKEIKAIHEALGYQESGTTEDFDAFAKKLRQEKSSLTDEQVKGFAEFEKQFSVYLPTITEYGEKLNTFTAPVFLQDVEPVQRDREKSLREVQEGSISLNPQALGAFFAQYGKSSEILRSILATTTETSRENWEAVKAFILTQDKLQKEFADSLSSIKSVELSSLGLDVFEKRAASPELLKGTLFDPGTYPTALRTTVPGGVEFEEGHPRLKSKEFYIPSPSLRQTYKDPTTGEYAPNEVTRALRNFLTQALKVQTLGTGGVSGEYDAETITKLVRESLLSKDALKKSENALTTVSGLLDVIDASKLGTGKYSTANIRKMIEAGDPTNKIVRALNDIIVGPNIQTAEKQLAVLISMRDKLDALKEAGATEDVIRKELASIAPSSIASRILSPSEKGGISDISRYLGGAIKGEEKKTSFKGLLYDKDLDISTLLGFSEQLGTERPKAIEKLFEREFANLKDREQAYQKALGQQTFGKAKGVEETFYSRKVPYSVAAKATVGITDKSADFAEAVDTLLSIGGFDKEISRLAAVSKEHVRKLEFAETRGIPVLGEREIGISEYLAKKIKVIDEGIEKDLAEFIKESGAAPVSTIRFPFTGASSIQGFRANLLEDSLEGPGKYTITVPGVPELDNVELTNIINELQKGVPSRIEEREALWRQADVLGGTEEGMAAAASAASLTKEIETLIGAIKSITPKYHSMEQKLDFDGDTIYLHAGTVQKARDEIEKQINMLDADSEKLTSVRSLFNTVFTAYDEGSAQTLAEQAVIFGKKHPSEKGFDFLQQPYIEEDVRNLSLKQVKEGIFAYTKTNKSLEEYTKLLDAGVKAEATRRVGEGEETSAIEEGLLRKKLYEKRLSDAISGQLYKIDTGPTVEGIRRIASVTELETGFGTGIAGTGAGGLPPSKDFLDYWPDESVILGNRPVEEFQTRIQELMRFVIQKGMDIKHAGAEPVAAEVFKRINREGGAEELSEYMKENAETFGELLEFDEQIKRSVELRAGALSTDDLRAEFSLFDKMNRNVKSLDREQLISGIVESVNLKAMLEEIFRQLKRQAIEGLTVKTKLDIQAFKETGRGKDAYEELAEKIGLSEGTSRTNTDAFIRAYATEQINKAAISEKGISAKQYVTGGRTPLYEFRTSDAPSVKTAEDVQKAAFSLQQALALAFSDKGDRGITGEVVRSSVENKLAEIERLKKAVSFDEPPTLSKARILAKTGVDPFYSSETTVPQATVNVAQEHSKRLKDAERIVSDFMGSIGIPTIRPEESEKLFSSMLEDDPGTIKQFKSIEKAGQVAKSEALSVSGTTEEEADEYARTIVKLHENTLKFIVTLNEQIRRMKEVSETLPFEEAYIGKLFGGGSSGGGSLGAVLPKEFNGAMIQERLAKYAASLTGLEEASFDFRNVKLDDPEELLRAMKVMKTVASVASQLSLDDILVKAAPEAELRKELKMGRKDTGLVRGTFTEGTGATAGVLKINEELITNAKKFREAFAKYGGAIGTSGTPTVAGSLTDPLKTTIEHESLHSLYALLENYSKTHNDEITRLHAHIKKVFGKVVERKDVGAAASTYGLKSVEELFSEAGVEYLSGEAGKDLSETGRLMGELVEALKTQGKGLKEFTKSTTKKIIDERAKSLKSKTGRILREDALGYASDIIRGGGDYDKTSKLLANRGIGTLGKFDTAAGRELSVGSKQFKDEFKSRIYGATIDDEDDFFPPISSYSDDLDILQEELDEINKKAEKFSDTMESTFLPGGQTVAAGAGGAGGAGGGDDDDLEGFKYRVDREPILATGGREDPEILYHNLLIMYKDAIERANLGRDKFGSELEELFNLSEQGGPGAGTSQKIIQILDDTEFKHSDFFGIWQEYRKAINKYFINRIEGFKKAMENAEASGIEGDVAESEGQFAKAVRDWRQYIRRTTGSPTDIYSYKSGGLRPQVSPEAASAAGLYVDPTELGRVQADRLPEHLRPILHELTKDLDATKIDEMQSAMFKVRDVFEKLSNVDPKFREIAADADLFRRLGTETVDAWNLDPIINDLSAIRGSLEVYNQLRVEGTGPDLGDYSEAVRKNVTTTIQLLKRMETEIYKSQGSELDLVPVPKELDFKRQQELHKRNIAKIRQYYARPEEFGGPAKGEAFNYKERILDPTGQIRKNVVHEFRRTGETDTGRGVFKERSEDLVRSFQGRKGIGQAFRRVALWGSASAIVWKTVGALKSMVDTITEVEVKMADLRQVMNPLTTDFNMMQTSALDFAQEYGQSIEGVLDGMRIFAQQGLSQAEVLDRTRTAALAANVTTLDAKDATEALTAAVRVYGKEGETTVKFLDAWSQVEARHAITSGNLADAMKKAGAAAKTAGFSFHELNAIVTGIGETTRQTGKEIGTSVRFIARRLFADKGTKSLQEVGITPTTETGEIRKGYDILGELAEQWNDLSKAQQLNIAISIGGRRHYNSIIALMDHWETVTATLTDSINSKGAAERRNAIVMETYAKKVQQLRAAVAELQVEFGKVALPFAKIPIDALRYLANVVSEVPTSVKIAFTAFAGFFTLLSKGQGIFSTISGFVNSLNGTFGDFVGGGLKDIRVGIYELFGKGLGDINTEGLTKLTEASGITDFESNLGQMGYVFATYGRDFNQFLANMLTGASKFSGALSGVFSGLGTKLFSDTALSAFTGQAQVAGVTGSGALAATSGSKILDKFSDVFGAGAGKFASFAGKESSFVKSIAPVAIATAGMIPVVLSLAKGWSRLTSSALDYEKSMEKVRRTNTEELQQLNDIDTFVKSYTSTIKDMKEALSQPEKTQLQISRGQYKSPLLGASKYIEEIGTKTTHIATLYPELIQGFDSYGNAILKANKSLEQHLSLLKSIKIKEILDDELDIIDKFVEDLSDTGWVEGLKEQLKLLFKETPGLSVFADQIDIAPAKELETALDHINKILHIRAEDPFAPVGESLKKHSKALAEIQGRYKETFTQAKKALSSLSTEGLSDIEIQELFNRETLNELYEVIVNYEIKPKVKGIKEDLGYDLGDVTSADVRGAEILKRAGGDLAGSYVSYTGDLTRERFRAAQILEREGKAFTNDIVIFNKQMADSLGIASAQGILEVTDDGTAFVKVVDRLTGAFRKVQWADDDVRNAVEAIFPVSRVQETLTTQLESLQSYMVGAASGLTSIINNKAFRKDIGLGARFFSQIPTESLIQTSAGYDPLTGRYGEVASKADFPEQFNKFVQSFDTLQGILESVASLEEADQVDTLTTGKRQDLDRYKRLVRNNQVAIQFNALMVDFNKAMEESNRALSKSITLEKDRAKTITQTFGLLAGLPEQIQAIDFGKTDISQLSDQERILYKEQALPSEERTFTNLTEEYRIAQLRRKSLINQRELLVSLQADSEALLNMYGEGNQEAILNPEQLSTYIETAKVTGDKNQALAFTIQKSQLKVQEDIRDNTAEMAAQDRPIEAITADIKNITTGAAGGEGKDILNAMRGLITERERYTSAGRTDAVDLINTQLSVLSSSLVTAVGGSFKEAQRVLDTFFELPARKGIEALNIYEAGPFVRTTATGQDPSRSRLSSDEFFKRTLAERVGGGEGLANQFDILQKAASETERETKYTPEPFGRLKAFFQLPIGKDEEGYKFQFSGLVAVLQEMIKNDKGRTEAEIKAIEKSGVDTEVFKNFSDYQQTLNSETVSNLIEAINRPSPNLEAGKFIQKSLGGAFGLTAILKRNIGRQLRGVDVGIEGAETERASVVERYRTGEISERDLNKNVEKLDEEITTLRAERERIQEIYKEKLVSQIAIGSGIVAKTAVQQFAPGLEKFVDALGIGGLGTIATAYTAAAVTGTEAVDVYKGVGESGTGFFKGLIGKFKKDSTEEQVERNIKAAILESGAGDYTELLQTAKDAQKNEKFKSSIDKQMLSSSEAQTLLLASIDDRLAEGEPGERGKKTREDEKSFFGRKSKKVKAAILEGDNFEIDALKKTKREEARQRAALSTIGSKLFDVATAALSVGIPGYLFEATKDDKEINLLKSQAEEINKYIDALSKSPKGRKILIDILESQEKLDKAAKAKADGIIKESTPAIDVVAEYENQIKKINELLEFISAEAIEAGIPTIQASAYPIKIAEIISNDIENMYKTIQKSVSDLDIDLKYAIATSGPLSGLGALPDRNQPPTISELSSTQRLWRTANTDSSLSGLVSMLREEQVNTMELSTLINALKENEKALYDNSVGIKQTEKTRAGQARSAAAYPGDIPSDLAAKIEKTNNTYKWQTELQSQLSDKSIIFTQRIKELQEAMQTQKILNVIQALSDFGGEMNRLSLSFNKARDAADWDTSLFDRLIGGGSPEARALPTIEAVRGGRKEGLSDEEIFNLNKYELARLSKIGTRDPSTGQYDKFTKQEKQDQKLQIAIDKFAFEQSKEDERLNKQRAYVEQLRSTAIDTKYKLIGTEGPGSEGVAEMDQIIDRLGTTLETMAEIRGDSYRGTGDLSFVSDTISETTRRLVEQAQKRKETENENTVDNIQKGFDPGADRIVGAVETSAHFIVQGMLEVSGEKGPATYKGLQAAIAASKAAEMSKMDVGVTDEFAYLSGFKDKTEPAKRSTGSYYVTSDIADNVTYTDDSSVDSQRRVREQSFGYNPGISFGSAGDPIIDSAVKKKAGAANWIAYPDAYRDTSKNKAGAANWIVDPDAYRDTSGNKAGAANWLLGYTDDIGLSPADRTLNGETVTTTPKLELVSDVVRLESDIVTFDPIQVASITDAFKGLTNSIDSKGNALGADSNTSKAMDVLTNSVVDVRDALSGMAAEIVDLKTKTLENANANSKQEILDELDPTLAELKRKTDELDTTVIALNNEVTVKQKDTLTYIEGQIQVLRRT